MNNKNINKIELLSPAGNYDCFLAAINNGADAVYLAGDKFGARAYAGNFTEEEIISAISYAHLYGKKIYLTVNTVLKENEIIQLKDYIKNMYIAGLDGVIVQDIGVISVLRDNFPGLEIHASTQMSITDSYGVEVLKKLGVCRVVTAREISLNEISQIIRETGIEIETFVHGAMCYCYSGKCLYSSILGGRSGNRGRCAQPCRLVYNDKYPLSMKDLNSLNILPSLIEAGISSLKIEGRMKNSEYVACVTGIYRNDMDLILDVYTRGGNCNGYYSQYNGRNMVTLDFPGYNGSKNYKNELEYYITKKNPKIDVIGIAEFKEGKHAKLSIKYDSIYITAEGDVIEKAQKRPTDYDTVKRQLLKTGDTSFDFFKLDIDCEDDIFVPVSKINELRRNAFELLENEIISKYRRTFKEQEDIDTSDLNVTNNDIISYAAEALCEEQYFELDKWDYISEIIIPSYLLVSINLRDGNVNVNKNFLNYMINNFVGSKKIFIKLPYVLRRINETYINSIKDIINRLCPEGVFVSNYESLDLLKSIDFSGNIIADMHMYGNNSRALFEYKKLGITNTAVPVELNRRELINRGITGEVLTVYGKIPLMISAQCVRKTLSKCEHARGFFEINDRKNNVNPVFCNCEECLTIHYNNIPILIDHDNDIVDKLKPSILRICFTNESIEEMRTILDYYSKGGEIPIKSYTKGHLNRGVE